MCVRTQTHTIVRWEEAPAHGKVTTIIILMRYSSNNAINKVSNGFFIILNNSQFKMCF